MNKASGEMENLQVSSFSGLSSIFFYKLRVQTEVILLESILHSRTDEHFLSFFWFVSSFLRFTSSSSLLFSSSSSSSSSSSLVLCCSYDPIPSFELLTFGGDFPFSCR